MRFLKIIILLFPVFLSCGKDGSSPQHLGIDGNTLYLWCGENRSIDVLSGSVVKIVSSDTAILTARYESGKIVLLAHRPGLAEVTCQFSDGEVIMLHCEGCTLQETWFEDINLTKTYHLESVYAEANDKAKEFINTNIYWDIPALTGGSTLVFNNGNVTVTPYPGMNYTENLNYAWNPDNQRLTLIDSNGMSHDYECEIMDLSHNGYPNFILAIHIDATKAYQENFPNQVKRVILTRYLVSRDYMWR